MRGTFLVLKPRRHQLMPVYIRGELNNLPLLSASSLIPNRKSELSRLATNLADSSRVITLKAPLPLHLHE